MIRYKNPEEKRRVITEFLKKNPNATCKQLKRAGFGHIERLFKKGLGEAYKKAGLELPRTFKKKTRKERRRIIIAYIKKNPKAGGQDIKKDTKINIRNAFNSTKEAFEAAGVLYNQEKLCKLRLMSREEKRSIVFELLRENPESTFEDIRSKTDINPYKIFKNLGEAYEEAGVKKITRHKKRKIRKQKIIIDFIKSNPTATQREINKACRTRIQGLFKNGIFGAYKEAEVNFPFERLKFHGSAIKEVKQRAKDFEEEVARKLSCYGNVNRLVKTKRGIADIILERKGKKIIIEVKDYLNKEVSEHEIKQLNKYLEDCGCNLGFLICHKKPKKDKFLTDENKIFILESSELNKIPELI